MEEDLFENETTELQPFSLADTPVIKKKCIDCAIVDDCPIIVYVNELEKERCKRNNKEFTSVEEEFGCEPFFRSTEQ